MNGFTVSQQCATSQIPSIRNQDNFSVLKHQKREYSFENFSDKMHCISEPFKLSICHKTPANFLRLSFQRNDISRSQSFIHKLASKVYVAHTHTVVCSTIYRWVCTKIGSSYDLAHFFCLLLLISYMLISRYLIND